MSYDKDSLDFIADAGLRQLAQDFRTRISGLKPESRLEYFCKLALWEAWVALTEGNYGIGAVITRKNKVVIKGHNRVFFPYYRSGHHAEMDTVDQHEHRMASRGPRVDGFTLITTLEPCPMCYTRILTAGIKQVYFLAVDKPAGMIQMVANLKKRFNSLWVELAKQDGRNFAVAPVRQEFGALSMDLFLATKDNLDAALINRGGAFSVADEIMLGHYPEGSDVEQACGCIHSHPKAA